MAFGLIGLSDSWQEFKRPNFWRDCLVDFYVTFFLMFVVLLLAVDVGNPNNNLIVGLVAGMCVFANIEGYGHVQWAVMNPVAALIFMFTKRISFFKFFFYIIFDLLACVCAAYFIRLVLPVEVVSSYKTIKPLEGVSGLQAMVIEWVLVTAHQSTLLGTLDDRHRTVMMPGLAVGMTTFVGIAAGFKITGGILNPFVVLPFAILSGDFSTQWIYWVGDFLGGITALLFYHFTLYNKGFFTVVPSGDTDENDEISTTDRLLDLPEKKDDAKKRENGQISISNEKIHDKMTNV